MKCLRCGHCCIGYLVSVVKPEYIKEKLNLNKLPEEAWLFLVDDYGKPIACPHLSFNDDNEARCGIHNYEWYKETACFAHTQVESSEDCECRLGAFITKYEKRRKIR